MKLLPQARSKNIVVQELGKEILIYDLNTHKAFNLNETSAIVYKSCDGKTTFQELKTKNKFTDDLIYLALDELKRESLINEDYESPFSTINRRDVIRKVGLATMIALPVISSLLAPTAAQAQSGVVGLGASCTSATCTAGLSCTTQFGSTVCRAPTGQPCDISRPDLCTSGCCTSTGAPPGSFICC